MEKIKEIDARGLSCPQPVILTKKAIQDNIFPFCVLVDSQTSYQNVARMVNKAGLNHTIEETGDEYKITVGK